MCAQQVGRVLSRACPSSTDVIIDEAANLSWPDDIADKDSKMVMPGDNVEMICEIHNPLAVESGQRFNIREGGRTVATGLVTQVLQ